MTVQVAPEYAVLALLWSVNAMALSPPTLKVTGYNVDSIQFTDINGRELGQYVQRAGSAWVETNKEGHITFNFRETKRDEGSVSLRDDSRELSVRLDLLSRKVMLLDTGTQSHLYNISKLTAMPPGSNRVAACYWMSERAPHQWISKPAMDQQACYEMDSCNGGKAASGTGCFKWAECDTCDRYPWSQLKPNPTPPATSLIDTYSYHRLTTQFRGSSLCLDVFNGGARNNMLYLATCEDYSGQFWRIDPADNGFYRLNTMFRGDKLCLDIFNGGIRNNQPYLTACGNHSGQFWSLQRQEGDWYRLSTQFRGNDMCLDVFNGGNNNNSPYLTDCNDRSGQLWRLMSTHRFVVR